MTPGRSAQGRSAWSSRWRVARGTAMVVLAAVVPGCDDDTGAGGGVEAVGVTFDPAVVEAGDTVGGLVVGEVDVQPMQGEPGVWVGTVRFLGELTLAGVLQPHFDYPEVGALCYHPDPASAARLPGFAPDRLTGPGRKRWFCFRDPAAMAGSSPGAWEAGDAREARVVVRDYTAHRYFTDAWDEAELVRVEALGAERAPTLPGMEAQPSVSASISIPQREGGKE